MAVRSEVRTEKGAQFGLFWKDCGAAWTVKPRQQRVEAMILTSSVQKNGAQYADRYAAKQHLFKCVTDNMRGEQWASKPGE